MATLLDGSPQSLHALEVAVTLSNHIPLHIFIPASEQGDVLRDRAMPLLERLQHTALFIPIDDTSPETIAINVRTLRASLLVLGYAERYRDPDVLESLQTATGTPLILAN